MALYKINENPEIYNIKIPLHGNPLRDLNIYVIVSDGEALFIDTGFRREDCRKPLLEGIRELGIPWERMRLFITHMHSDHAGQTDVFTSRGCPAYMNVTDIRWLKRMINGKGKSDISERLRQNGFPREELRQANRSNPMYAFAPLADLTLNPVTDGSRLRVGSLDVRVVQTGGHTPGHSCLYLEKAGILFSGDHILYDISPNITIWCGVADSLGAYIDSLKWVDELPFTIAYPAHRDLHPDPHGRIRELLAHHKARLNEAFGLVQEYPGSTGYEIGSRMKWSIRCSGWQDFPVTQKWFAVAEAMAHLDWLERRGKVYFEEKNGIFHVYPAKDGTDMENQTGWKETGVKPAPEPVGTEG